MDKQHILDFIQKHKLAVLSTVTPENTPESAVVHFVITAHFEIIFNTFSTYRKYKNINQNKNVSLVIGWDEGITVQYEGKAQEVHGKEMVQYKEMFKQRHPASEKWDNSLETRYFKVIPTWIRYSDVREFGKEKIAELSKF